MSVMPLAALGGLHLHLGRTTALVLPQPVLLSAGQEVRMAHPPQQTVSIPEGRGVGPQRPIRYRSSW
jgi:hypothetical protein